MACTLEPCAWIWPANGSGRWLSRPSGAADSGLCVCDCGRTRDVRRRELLRYGDGTTCGDWRVHRRADVVSYGGAHDRLERDRGRAKDHRCVDCGGRAAHWSYDHADPDELVSPEGFPYSLDGSHYEPRCNVCHALFDQARNRPHFFVGCV